MVSSGMLLPWRLVAAVMLMVMVAVMVMVVVTV
jgi:hypothetical protein